MNDLFIHTPFGAAKAIAGVVRGVGLVLALEFSLWGILTAGSLARRFDWASGAVGEVETISAPRLLDGDVGSPQVPFRNSFALLTPPRAPSSGAASDHRNQFAINYRSSAHNGTILSSTTNADRRQCP